MGYINFQLQNNSCSIIFQARKKRRKKKTCYLYYLFLTEKRKYISKKRLTKEYQEILQKLTVKNFS